MIACLGWIAMALPPIAIGLVLLWARWPDICAIVDGFRRLAEGDNEEGTQK